ncbi:hypothetical protein ASD04_00070 [Devosia sp. Root436]|uniref:hypothetical protein n=1 Tax=Devosia sp. Root436 TaxID=1736537 RepID=UPI0006F93251|nr:hypothetical protein [Devosia sp. Root436]KQX42405.1 hypothetical protein ASD04_00070 [Devosia sp. Root436]
MTDVDRPAQLSTAVRDALAHVERAQQIVSEMLLADETEAFVTRHLYVAERALTKLQQELDALRAGGGGKARRS